ncbi:MAG: flippase-like domain-containing protein [Chloracidobacterium sp.]|nr:flippase-like domain-containing protein [Chloracidobacterium sp.]MCO5332502.1 flippase-like domain-containing protein [Pyrinomonadaceae bacterium]
MHIGISTEHISKIKIAAAILTVIGVVLFADMLWTVGLDELWGGIERFGAVGFAVILALFFVRIVIRAYAWSLSVYGPYYLKMRQTVPAVVIGEATSSVIPLGILMSGTAKAVAVRDRVPLAVGLSSVATENLFYSLVTSIFLVAGAVTFLRVSAVDEGWVWTINVLIVGIAAVLLFLILLVVKQWHFASEACERLYRRGHFRSILENGRLEVRLFENMIFGFYRRYPKRFLPICLFEVLYHAAGIAETYYILERLDPLRNSVMTSFLLESVSRLMAILFKLIPLTIGVDEAGAKFVGETVALAAGVGVTLALIRKGRMLFWTAIGFLLIVKRGLRFSSRPKTNT